MLCKIDSSRLKSRLRRPLPHSTNGRAPSEVFGLHLPILSRLFLFGLRSHLHVYNTYCGEPSSFAFITQKWSKSTYANIKQNVLINSYIRYTPTHAASPRLSLTKGPPASVEQSRWFIDYTDRSQLNEYVFMIFLSAGG